MATYVIGDVQGCYHELRNLLTTISFDADCDRLWFVGDLVNRGPNSLEALRFVKELGDKAVTVLGNHDLHLLGVAQGRRSVHKRDTFVDVLSSPDKKELLNWLRHRPLLYSDKDSGYTIIHAGLPPQWDMETAESMAQDVEKVLKTKKYKDFFKYIYQNGNDMPLKWSSNFKPLERLQYAASCFTRLRYCDSDGNLELRYTGPPGTQPAPYMPWFQVPGRKHEGHKIIVGHWASLGFCSENGVITLDTGCVWGGALTAFCLETGQRYSVPCLGTLKPGED
jgi:bis(5'-nucleosyl)-tetraphosphatase (symmetrical)